MFYITNNIRDEISPRCPKEFLTVFDFPHKKVRMMKNFSLDGERTKEFSNSPVCKNNTNYFELIKWTSKLFRLVRFGVVLQDQEIIPKLIIFNYINHSRASLMFTRNYFQNSQEIDIPPLPHNYQKFRTLPLVSHLKISQISHLWAKSKVHSYLKIRILKIS